jgi:hypothetical protein
MGYGLIVRTGSIAVLAAGLAGCMDVTMDIEVLSESTARGTMTTTMGSDIYAMMSAQVEEGEEFCEGGEIVTEGELVSCVVVEEGDFDELTFEDSGEEGLVMEAIGNGQVRVAFPTGDLADDIAEQAGTESDPQLEAMIAAMFEGHGIVISVSGGEILDTNMTVSEDGQSASYEIPFTLLLSGEAELPEEIFAVVQK